MQKLTDNQVKKLIRKATGTRRFTQTQLATEFGISQAQVSRILNGIQRWNVVV